jgi:hypothetical protein
MHGVRDRSPGFTHGGFVLHASASARRVRAATGVGVGGRRGHLRPCVLGRGDAGIARRRTRRESSPSCQRRRPGHLRHAHGGATRQTQLGNGPRRRRGRARWAPRAAGGVNRPRRQQIRRRCRCPQRCPRHHPCQGPRCAARQTQPGYGPRLWRGPRRQRPRAGAVGACVRCIAHPFHGEPQH